MTHFFAQVWLIFKHWGRHSRGNFLKFLFAVAGSVLAIWLFVHCNEIPIKQTAIRIDTAGDLVGAHIDADINLGITTHITSLDSVKFANSGAIGSSLNIRDTIADRLTWDELLADSTFRTWHADLDSAMHRHADTLLDLTSIHGLYRGYIRHDLLARTPVKERDQSQKGFLYMEDDGDQGLRVFAYDIVAPGLKQFSIDFLNGMDRTVDEPISITFFAGTGLIPYIELADVSQDYIKVSIDGDAFSRGARLERLTIDFGSPVEFSMMDPAPDKTDMTRITFTDSDKIQAVIDDDLLFHVTYLQNRNIQSVKLFFLTTVLTVLLTWSITLLFALLRSWIAARKAVRKRKG